MKAKKNIKNSKAQVVGENVVVHHTRKSPEKSLNFVVQMSEPKNLRKDILEALREIILFMQGYETFMRIQEEKIATFAKLHEDVKVLNDLINNKLRRHMPKGKLKGIKIKMPKMIAEEPVIIKEETPLYAEAAAPARKESSSDLDDLEMQLKDIENRLKRIS